MKAAKAEVIQLPGISISKGVDDPIFFRKEQLKLNTALVYYGRHKPDSKWFVSRIWTFHLINGQYRSHRVSTPRTLSDAVEVTCEDGTIMELTFQYLSYSAIWRLL